MMNMFQKDKTKTTSASVVDGKLILSFPHAQTPVLWQMDLAQAKASSLEVTKSEKGKVHSLTLKTQKGENVKVASFDNREDALAGLMAAADALEKAHGNIQVAANDGQKVAVSPAQKQASKNRWVTGFFAVAALIVIIGLWSAVTPRSPQGLQASNSAIAAQGQQGSAASQAGVPMSADAFLGAQ